VVKSFSHELPISATLDVLVLPYARDEDGAAVGTKGNSRFETAVSLIADGNRSLFIRGSLALVVTMLGTLFWMVQRFFAPLNFENLR
jgi:hypothetical protein